MNSEKEDVTAVLKSCLLTFKNGTNLAMLNEDYKKLEGRNIPFKLLGFSSLESFIQDIPGIRTMRRGMDLWVETVPTKETEHISKMIAEQNQPKIRRRHRTSNLRQGSRGSQGMSRVRPISLAYRSSSRSYGTSFRSNKAPQLTPYSPKPLMQQSYERPLSLAGISSGNHRFSSSTGPQIGSPSKRLMDRKIQENHDLDYAPNRRPITNLQTSKPAISVATSTPTPNPTPAPIPTRLASQNVNIPKIQTFNEISDSTISRQPEIRPLRPILPSSSVENPPIMRRVVLEPLLPTPSRIPWQPPPSRLVKIADRLNVQPTSSTFNSTVTNDNGTIQITVQNPQNQNGIRSKMAIPESQDPREELRRITRELNKPDPVYKIKPLEGKTGSSVYGLVQIGMVKFSSYPQEAKTEHEAQKLAALDALVELRKEHSSILRLQQTADKNLVKSRVHSIVDQHNGVFIHKIPVFYREQYKENLPDDWTDYISQWSELTTDKGVDSIILRRADPSTPDKAPKLSQTVEKGFLKHICLVKPGPLELPEDEFWPVYVTLVVSTNEIWVRLIDDENYSAKLEAMTAEMAHHYSSIKSINCEHVERDGYYVKKENDTWHRVRVLEYDLTSGQAEVFFIDMGDIDVVNISELLPLDRKFCSLAAQAMKVSLAGLDDFSNCDSIVKHIEECLLDSTFYVEILERHVDEDGPTAEVSFCDTSGSEDVEVNRLIGKKILQTFTPKLEGKDKVAAVYISHVESNGDVYVQVENEGMKILTEMLNKVTHTGLSADELKRCALKRFDRNTIYFVRCKKSGDWYRGKFVDVASDSKNCSQSVKMFLIDFGRTIIVDLSNVIQLEILYELLAKYPAQAIKVRLDNIDPDMFNDKMIEKIKELAPPSQLLHSKIIKPSTSDSPPIVELFKRIQPDNVLVSINNTLVLEPELTSVSGDGNNNVTRQSRRRVERTISRTIVEPEETANSLPAPKISEIGEYFDVHVTMAAHPTHFTIQPYETKEELLIMMMKLQDACASSIKVTHPSLESIREGRLYAAKHRDGDWYRGCVLNVIADDRVSIYFVDYGDVVLMSIDKLQPLAKQFLDLPYQAIKARLVGIKPKNIDWTPEDCVRFQELTVDRDLVSTVVEVYPDRHLPRDTVLGLTLIDVSTNDDLFIGEILVQEGRAVYAD